MTKWIKQYDAYLFDLDGTLIDTAPDINAALNFCLRSIGLEEVDESLTRHWVGHGARAVIAEALSHQQANTDAATVDIEALLPDFLEYYENNIAVRSKAYPTVESTLSSLRERGAGLAVVTNKLTVLTERLLADIGMRDLFDIVVCGDTLPVPKPDPGPVLHALAHFGLDAKEALFVGDSDTDVKAAQAANMTVVCMRDGYNHGVDVATLSPDGVIDTFAELLEQN